MKEQMTARGRFIIVAALLGATAVLVSGCGIEAPKAPSWDTTLTVPLVNRTFTSSELFDKLASDNIATDSLGNRYLSIERQLDTVGFEALLEIDAIESGYEEQVGPLKLSKPSDLGQSIELADHIPLILGEVPDTGVVVNTGFGPVDSFSEVEIEHGSLSITAVNNTGFALDSLSGQLRHPVTHALLAQFVAPGGLANGESYSQQFAMDNQELAATADFDVYFHTPGGPALSLADRAINFSISFGDEIYARSISGRIDEFETSYAQRTKLAEEIEIHSARLNSGQLMFSAANDLSVGAALTVSFPEITNQGQALSFELNSPAHSQQQYQIDLSGWTIEPANDSLLTNIAARIAGSGGGFVTVSELDAFAIEYSVADIGIAEAIGVVPPTELEWSATEVEIDVPTGFDAAALDFVELTIEVVNNSELSGEVELELSASNGKQKTITGAIAGKFSQAAAISQIYSDELADLLSPLPDEINVTGITLLGDGVSEVTFGENDFVTATAKISAPMAFVISEATVEGDQNEIEVSEEISDRADRLNGGRFVGSITNHLPVGATLELYIAADSASLYSDPLTIIGPLSFGAAPTDGNGLVSEELVAENEIELTDENLRVLENRNLYVAPVLQIPSSNGQVVRIRAADYLVIFGTLEIQARVGGEDF